MGPLRDVIVFFFFPSTVREDIHVKLKSQLRILLVFLFKVHHEAVASAIMHHTAFSLSVMHYVSLDLNFFFTNPHRAELASSK